MMKKPCIRIFILVTGFLSASQDNITAQDSTSLFVLNVGGSIYSQQEKSPNYFLYPTPEIEIMYKIRSFKTLTFFAGCQYIYSYSHHDLGYKSEWRRKAHELELSLLVDQGIGKYISLTGGVSVGYLIQGEEEYKSNIPANKDWENITSQTGYNESSKFYLVFYIDPKVKYDLDAMNTLSIGPTIKYYAKDNWMKEVRHKTMIGISLQYSFRF